MRAYFCDNCRDWVPSSAKHRCDGCGQYLGDASPKLLSDDSPEALRVIALAAANAKVVAERSPVASQSPTLAATSQRHRRNSPPTTGRAQTTHCSQCGAESVEGARFCHGCGSPMVATPSTDAGLADVYARLTALETMVAEYSDLFDEHADEINEDTALLAAHETILASSNVYHSEFWPRAWAIFGHSYVIGFVVQVALFFLMLSFLRLLGAVR